MGKRFSEAKARWAHSCALSQMVGKRLQNFEGRGWKGWAAMESKFVGWGSLCTRRKPFPSNCFECLQDEAFCQLRYDVPFSHRGDWGGKGKKKGNSRAFFKSKGVGDLQSRIVCGTHDERRGRYLQTHCRHGF
eukprot:scaffold44_cov339-Pavlova_lutheri.AAC.22